MIRRSFLAAAPRLFFWSFVAGETVCLLALFFLPVFRLTVAGAGIVCFVLLIQASREADRQNQYDRIVRQAEMMVRTGKAAMTPAGDREFYAMLLKLGRTDLADQWKRERGL